MRVGGEPARGWSEGEVLAFEDSFEHEVWQEANEDRIVLVVDIWHPDLSDERRSAIVMQQADEGDPMSLDEYFAKRQRFISEYNWFNSSLHP